MVLRCRAAPGGGGSGGRKVGITTGQDRIVMKGFIFLKLYTCLISSGRNIHILSLRLNTSTSKETINLLQNCTFHTL